MNTRIAPLSAPSGIKQLTVDLQRLLTDFRAVCTADPFEEDLERLWKNSRGPIRIDIPLPLQLTSETAAGLAAIIGFGLTADRLMQAFSHALPEGTCIHTCNPEVDLFLWQLEQMPARLGNSYIPPMLLCAPPWLDTDTDRLVDLEIAANGRPFVLLLKLPESVLPHSTSAALGNAARTEVLDWPQWTLESFVSQQQEGFLEKLRDLSLVQSLRTILSMIDHTFERESGRIEARLLRIQQKQKEVQMPRQSASAIITQIKSLLQQHLTPFEREAEERLQSLLAAKIGTLWAETDEWIAAVETLTEERESRSILFRMDEKDMTQLRDTLRQRLQQHILFDLQALERLQKKLGALLQGRLESCELNSFSSSFGLPPAEKLNRLLDNVTVFHREHEGESPRQNLMEAFMGVRRYWMMFAMILSPFGLMPILRNYSEFFIPLTVALMSAGIFSALHSFKREKEETRKAQLSKAHEVLRAEFRRIGADFQMKWGVFIRQHLADEVQRIVTECDSHLRDQLQSAANGAAEQKQKLQVDLQLTQAMEKNLTAFARSKETLSNHIRQAQSDLELAIATQNIPSEKETS